MGLRSVLLNCKNNSLKDQKILYEYSFTELFHVCLRYTQNQQDAEEVFNLAMLKIFQYIITDKNEIQNYLGFCARILRLTGIDYYKGSLSPVLYNSSLVYENDTYNSVDQAFEALEVEDIFAIIQSLPHKERIVFSMFEIDGFSHREIALELEINENYSKWLLHNAKKLLKVKMIQKGIKSYNL